ncbi:hypothetical protein FJW04_17835 [Mesorhizobium sp. B2-7-3]|uniref:hypothetical protein n=1 Tax=Mesorhizobium sp. B2-7-3 TaxID=2589907 RepID=UPI001125FD5A|nr:hypothetical protein [Mesorhizobium sp. B2-7-3]TPJ14349.1 hypothetical protein FJW04_17835 [Mesorhizobium sp. B2-7-3]
MFVYLGYNTPDPEAEMSERITLAARLMEYGYQREQRTGPVVSKVQLKGAIVVAQTCRVTLPIGTDCEGHGSRRMTALPSKGVGCQSILDRP